MKGQNKLLFVKFTLITLFRKPFEKKTIGSCGIAGSRESDNLFHDLLITMREVEYAVRWKRGAGAKLERQL